MRDCPFCHKGVQLDAISLTKLGDDELVFHHYCYLDRPGLYTSITVHGKTEQEIKNRWNGVYEKPTSESL